MKHTPGPWEVEPFLFDSEIIVRGKNFIATIGAVAPSDDADKLPHEVQRANARLIAAAPELLEALKGMMKAYDTEAWGVHLDMVPEWRAAHAAIAKAEEKGEN